CHDHPRAFEWAGQLESSPRRSGEALAHRLLGQVSRALVERVGWDARRDSHGPSRLAHLRERRSPPRDPGALRHLAGDWERLTEWLGEGSANKEARLTGLATILGARSIPGEIRYQLIHRAASAVLEARRFLA